MSKRELQKAAREYLIIHTQLEGLRKSIEEGSRLENEFATQLMEGVNIPTGKLGKATIIAETIIHLQTIEEVDQAVEDAVNAGRK